MNKWYDYKRQEFVDGEKVRQSMNPTERSLAFALHAASDKTGFDLQDANEYTSGDRRYKIFLLSRTTSWAHNEHGTIQYHGVKYDFQQYPEYYIVKQINY